MTKLHDLAREIAEIVEAKRASYGFSWPRAIADTMRRMYPDGIGPSQYEGAVFVARALDKLHRFAAAPDAFGEDPLVDLAGYALLALASARERDGVNHDPASRPAF
jgi:hypothetical protein